MLQPCVVLFVHIKLKSAILHHLRTLSRKLGDLPGLQSVKRSTGQRLPSKAIRLRASEGGSNGRKHTRLNCGGGDARVPGAGLHRDGAPDSKERRVELRSGPV